MADKTSVCLCRVKVKTVCVCTYIYTYSHTMVARLTFECKLSTRNLIILSRQFIVCFYSTGCVIEGNNERERERERERDVT